MRSHLAIQGPPWAQQCWLAWGDRDRKSTQRPPQRLGDPPVAPRLGEGAGPAPPVSPSMKWGLLVQKGSRVQPHQSLPVRGRGCWCSGAPGAAPAGGPDLLIKGRLTKIKTSQQRLPGRAASPGPAARSRAPLGHPSPAMGCPGVPRGPQTPRSPSQPWQPARCRGIRSSWVGIPGSIPRKAAPFLLPALLFVLPAFPALPLTPSHRSPCRIHRIRHPSFQ